MHKAVAHIAAAFLISGVKACRVPEIRPVQPIFETITGNLTTMDLFRKKSVDQLVSESTPLKRTLKTFDLTMLGIGAIIGTGIFVLTGKGALTAGPALCVSFLLAAVCCGFAGLCYAEFAAMAPVSGSAYSYAYLAFGELIAFVIGWV